MVFERSSILVAFGGDKIFTSDIRLMPPAMQKECVSVQTDPVLETCLWSVTAQPRGLGSEHPRPTCTPQTQWARKDLEHLDLL